METENITVLKSLVDFCHSQNLRVTAEGIENNDMMTKTINAGCDYLQGFFFSPPLPYEEILKLTSASFISK